MDTSPAYCTHPSKSPMCMCTHQMAKGIMNALIFRTHSILCPIFICLCLEKSECFLTSFPPSPFHSSLSHYHLSWSILQTWLTLNCYSATVAALCKRVRPITKPVFYMHLPLPFFPAKPYRFKFISNVLSPHIYNGDFPFLNILLTSDLRNLKGRAADGEKGMSNCKQAMGIVNNGD